MRGRGWFLGCALALMVLLLGSAQCFGAGFAIWEGSARGNALGQAVVGRADDPSALFYNPAGITQLPGFQVMAGGSAILLSDTVKTAAGSQSTNDNWGFPPQFYATYQLNDHFWAGLGVFTPFGLTVEFPQNWFGRFSSFDADVSSVTINPNIAWKITDQVSFAAGFEAMYFSETLKQFASLTLPPFLGGGQTPPVRSEIDGNSWGYGFNVAGHYKPCEFVSLGVSYRSQVTQEGHPSANLFDGTTGAKIFSTSAQSTTKLPQSVALGITFYPMKNLSWEVGAVWTEWSQFNAISFNFNPALQIPTGLTSPPFPPSVTSASVASTSVTKNWHDTWRFQTGIEYKALPWLDLRAGYIFDQEAISGDYADYLLPSNNRHFFSFGPGFRWGKYTLDLSYTYILIEDRTVNNSLSPGYINPSQLSGNANIIGLSLGYKF